MRANKSDLIATLRPILLGSGMVADAEISKRLQALAYGAPASQRVNPFMSTVLGLPGGDTVYRPPVSGYSWFPQTYMAYPSMAVDQLSRLTGVPGLQVINNMADRGEVAGLMDRLLSSRYAADKLRRTPGGPAELSRAYARYLLPALVYGAVKGRT